MTTLISILLLLIAINTTLNGIDNRKIKKRIKDIADNQFDAQQAMDLYAPKPQIITKNHDVVPLYAYYALPDFAEGQVTEDEIKKYLVDELNKQIFDYVEVEMEHDIVNMHTKFRAKLLVIKL